MTVMALGELWHGPTMSVTVLTSRGGRHPGRRQRGDDEGAEPERGQPPPARSCRPVRATPGRAHSRRATSISASSETAIASAVPGDTSQPAIAANDTAPAVLGSGVVDLARAPVPQPSCQQASAATPTASTPGCSRIWATCTSPAPSDAKAAQHRATSRPGLTRQAAAVVRPLSCDRPTPSSSSALPRCSTLSAALSARTFSELSRMNRPMIPSTR